MKATCDSGDEYGRILCNYMQQEFPGAIAMDRCDKLESEMRNAPREYPDVKNTSSFIDSILRNDREGAVEKAYAVDPRRFLIVVVKARRCYNKCESPWPDWDLERSGFKVVSRHPTMEERDKAWDELKKKQEDKKCQTKN